MGRSAVGSIKQLAPTKWRVQVSAGYDPASGNRRRLDRTITGGIRAAERARAAMLIEAGTVPEARDLSLTSYLEDMWLPSLKPQRVRELTLEGYTSKLKKHVIPYLGASKLPRVTPYMLDRWLAQLSAGGVGGHTALHAYRVLHTALQQAVKWRLITSNPMDAVERPEILKDYKPTILTAEQACEFLDAFKDHDLEPVVALAIGAGLRRSELAALTWADIDFTGETVAIRHGLHERKGRMWMEDPKTERSRRTVALPGFTMEILKRCRGVGGPIAPVDGRPMKPGVISQRFRAKVKDAKLTKIPLKDLRHSHATIALAQGVDITVISRRLGHSTVSTTDRYYLRPGLVADQDAAAKIGAIRPLPGATNGVDPPMRDKAAGEHGGPGGSQ